AVIGENVGKRWRNNCAETIVAQRPDGVFARRAATEILTGQKNACAAIPWLIQGKGRIRFALAIIAPVKEQDVAITRALNTLEKLFGDDLVGIDVVALKHGHVSRMNNKALHSKSVLVMPVAHVNKAAGNGSGSGHRRAYQVRAPARSLAPLEVAIAGGSAALAGLEPVGIHAQAHGASGLAPFKPGFSKDAMQAFLFG